MDGGKWHLSRATVVSWAGSFIDLLFPIYNSQQLSILDGKVISMDETPYKIGHSDGKMNNQYLWFMYGDKDEVLVHPNESRSAAVIEGLLTNSFKGTLLSDKFSAYEAAAKKLGLEVAHCWAHARRYFVEAEEAEPSSSKEAIDKIRKIYELESTAPPQPEKLLDYRLEQIKPQVDDFFQWLELKLPRLQGLPRTKYTKAVHYAMSAKAQLSVFLNNPGVPLDNNHTERQIRPLVIGRKNFLFCWTELGAERLAVLQSLLLTCQLHGVDAWEYLTDVAHRVSTHPASKVHELTPRVWKTLFSKAATATEILASSLSVTSNS